MEFKSNVGVNSRNEFNLSHNHVLTHNFGVMNCLSWMLTVPGDKIDVNLSSFTRLMPLPCPTFGGIKLIKRAFYVPSEFVLRGFSEFLNGEKHILSSGSLANYNIPFTYTEDVVWCFTNDATLSTAVTTGAYDFDDRGTHYKFTTKGRKLRSFLHTVGIKFPRVNFDLSSGTITNKQTYNKTYVDLLKLLSWWKFYLDWVVPARFLTVTPQFIKIKQYLEDVYYYGHSYFEYGGVTEGLSLEDLLLVPVSFLEDDFYTSAFVTAYGPESSQTPAVPGLEVRGSGSYNNVYNPTTGNILDGQPFVNTDTSAGGANVLTQIQMLSLGRLQDYVNTRKITDVHVLEWLRLTYGISPSKDALRLSSYLGSSENIIQIGDVMSNANTQVGSQVTYVGQFAGKGLGTDFSNWKFDCDKHGVLFITCEIQTKTSYVNGMSPLCQLKDRLDFFDPHFDNVGVRAISHRELVFDTFDTAISSDSTPDSQIPNADGIFGFAPRYSEYKHMDDIISGDFICPSVNSGLDSWYLSRQFDFESDPKISLDFCSAASDTVGSAYDRIFQNTNNDDHFYSVFNIGIKASRPMESTSDYFKTINSEDSKTVDVDNNNVIS